MSLARGPDARIAPDRGPIDAAVASAVLGAVAAIGAAAVTAIVLAAAFEVAPPFASLHERLLLIAGASRLAAEVVGPAVLAVSYRRGRGLPVFPDRLSILGLMGAVAALGVVAARVEANLGRWLGG